MDGQISISQQELYAAIGTASAPVLIDIRRDDSFAADDRMLVSARRRPPEHLGKWARDLPADRPVVVYCAHGHEVSQQAAAALRGAGIDAELWALPFEAEPPHSFGRIHALPSAGSPCRIPGDTIWLALEAFR